MNRKAYFYGSCLLYLGSVWVCAAVHWRTVDDSFQSSQGQFWCAHSSTCLRSPRNKHMVQACTSTCRAFPSCQPCSTACPWVLHLQLPPKPLHSPCICTAFFFFSLEMENVCSLCAGLLLVFESSVENYMAVCLILQRRCLFVANILFPFSAGNSGVNTRQSGSK